MKAMLPVISDAILPETQAAGDCRRLFFRRAHPTACGQTADLEAQFGQNHSHHGVKAGRCEFHRGLSPKVQDKTLARQEGRA